MKRFAVVLMLAVGLLAPAAEAAIITGDAVKLTGSLGSLGGGAFTVDGPGANDFLTFCMERDEYISYNTTYYAKLAMEAANGGAGGPSPDPLDSRTAYLYALFLDGYFGVPNALSQDAIDGLQLAFWRIEEEVDASYNGLGTATKRSLADQFFAVAGQAEAGNFYGVRIMQLWGAYNPTTGEFGGYKQDQLVRVPDGGATLMLLGTGLLGIGALRRRIGR